jgi:hypothetical protein
VFHASQTHEGNSFSPQIHGHTVLSGSGTELSTISSKSAGIIRIPHSSSNTIENSSKEGRKSETEHKDKKKNASDGIMTFARFKLESKLDEENIT